MKNNGGDPSFSNYVYCARRTHHVHSIVCAVTCPYYDRCEDLLHYEDNVRGFRKIASMKACGKQLRLVKEEVLEEAGRGGGDEVRTV